VRGRRRYTRPQAIAKDAAADAMECRIGPAAIRAAARRRVRRLIRGGLIVFAAVALAACSRFAPFETQTPNFGPGYQARATSQELVTAAGLNPAYAPVSVCYSRLAAAPGQVEAVAAEECGKDMTPKLVDQGVDLNACPLLIPVRATFTCAAH